MKLGRQTTLRDSVELRGAGVHSNSPVRLTLHPSDANTGIVFLRTGLEGGRERLIEAHWSKVSMTELCTVVGDHSRGAVSTIEHLMAALAGLGVDNALIEIDGPEVPIMDGSAGAFVEAIDSVGIATLAAPRRYIRIAKPVRVEFGRAFCEFRPAVSGFRMEIEIEYPTALIGRQKQVIDLDAARFRRDVARARTFGFVRQVEELWKKGFALGSSLENSVALSDEGILNPEGLRFSDEFVRHKTLDAVGDLALAGAPIIGAFRSFCGGHKMNNAVLRQLFADRSAYELVEAPSAGRGGQVDMASAAQPAFAPETN